MCGTSAEVVAVLLGAYPEGARVADDFGQLRSLLARALGSAEGRAAAAAVLAAGTSAAVAIGLRKAVGLGAGGAALGPPNRRV